jgi:hypothetical protein
MLTPGGGRGHASGRASSPFRREGDIMTVKRMDNIGIVVEDIDIRGPEGILIELAHELG